MTIRFRFHWACAPGLISCSEAALALDGRGGGPCGASLLHVMVNPVLIVIALAVTAGVGSALAAWRKRRDRSASVASRHRIFSTPAVIAGLCVYVPLVGMLWFASNLCF
ncbi:MAG: hypothetical protein V4764_00215 [Burkholderia sp.]